VDAEERIEEGMTETSTARAGVTHHARQMTVKERIALAAGTIDAMSEDEKALVRVLWVPVDWPQPPLEGVMQEAKEWARFAPIEQVKAIAAASFNRMPTLERKRFLEWAAKQRED